MPRYVALLRGVNLGGHTVKMDRLRGLFEELGFANVVTVIASGNVAFDAKSSSARALERRIAAHLENSLGFPAATFLRTGRELQRVLAHRAVATAGGRTVYVGFVAEPPPAAARARLLDYASAHDEFHVEGREVYWVCRTRMMSESPFFRVGIEKAIGMTTTVRNATTVARLVDVARAPARAAGAKR